MTAAQTYARPRVLVTSAAGRTAAPAVLSLLEKGFPVRAFVRRDDARAEVLRNAGAEIFVGNLFDQRDLRSALVDVQRRSKAKRSTGDSVPPAMATKAKGGPTTDWSAGSALSRAPDR